MILLLDTETTGKNPATDQIIELCIQQGLDGEPRTRRIKPTCPIHPEATAVHGITAEMLVDCPTFSQVGKDVARILGEATVIIGYGLAYDLDIIQAELARAGMPPLDLTGKHLIDSLRLWHHFEPRSLTAAHERFSGGKFEGAHGAAADVSATGRVLTGMLSAFGLVGHDWPAVAMLSNPFTGREKWIGPSHHIQWDNGAPVFAFGKSKGKRVDEVDPGYLTWVQRGEFPGHVKLICQWAQEMAPDVFLARCGTEFGTSMQTGKAAL